MVTLVFLVRIAAAKDLTCPRGAKLQGAQPPEGFKQWCELDDGTQHGPSHSWFADGARKAQANFDHGELMGAYRIFYPNGKPYEEGTYLADQKNGTFATWDENGTKLLEQKFVKDVRNGPVKQWYVNGELKFSEYYKDGKKQGAGN